MTEVCFALGVVGSDAIMHCLYCADQRGTVTYQEMRTVPSPSSTMRFVVLVPTPFERIKSRSTLNHPHTFSESHVLVAGVRIAEFI
jgi:hypothetical protein